MARKYITPCPRKSFSSLKDEYPEIAQYWDEEKNGFPASQCYPTTRYFAWWTCDKGHSYDKPVRSRTLRDIHYCPICEGKTIVPGINDIATVEPDIMTQWDDKKNEQLGLDKHYLAPNSNKTAWWICPQHGSVTYFLPSQSW